MAKQSALISSPAQQRKNKSVPLVKEREAAAQSDSQKEHYAAVIGAFQNDPMLDAMMENIRERRREIDADDTIN